MTEPLHCGAAADSKEIHETTMSRKRAIERTIRDALHPLHLEVADESHMHSVPEGAESHFKVTVISERFEGERLVARHRVVNGLLAAEFDTGLHALALHTWTPEEWFGRGGEVPTSPPCLGGSKSA
jgi:BolA protein